MAASPEISLLIMVIAGTVIGVLVGWTLRGRSGTNQPPSSRPGGREAHPDWPLEKIGDRHLGFIQARSGEAPRVSTGIADLLAGRGLDQPHDRVEDESDRWLAAVDVEDRNVLRSMLRLDEDEPDQIHQIRVRVPDVDPDLDRAGPSSLRWFEVRRVSQGDGRVELAMVDQTSQVLSKQQRMIQLRNQRLLARAAQMISLSEDFAEAISEVMLIYGEGLNLHATGWYSERADTEGLAWELQTGWSSDDDVSLPGCLEDIGARMASNDEPDAMILGIPGRPQVLLMPLVANQRVEALLGLEAHGGDPWSGDTLEIMRQLGVLLGRRFEQQIIDSEREAWAATRGDFERSEAIAQLTGGVVHDFNGVIFAVLGRFELLRDRITDPAAIRELDQIAETLQEAKRLGDRLRQSLNPAAEPLPLDVRVELEEICHGIKRLLPKRIDFDFNISLPTLVDPLELFAGINDLQRILMNLVVNARDAVDMHGRIQLGARMSEDGMIEIRVDDDGPGIPEADRNRMLEPYETGDHSDGVGLGLAVCKRTAEDLGGTLMLDDSPLGGLAARVTLPVRVKTGAGEPTGSAKEFGTPAEEIGRVLVVEDNPVIRDVLVRVLDSMGAQVVAQGHATDVEQLLTQGGDFDILIFDIDLPERTGIDCLRDLRDSGVETPCLLITGGNSTAPTSISNTEFLRKPFRIDTLRVSVRRLLKSGRGV